MVIHSCLPAIYILTFSLSAVHWIYEWNVELQKAQSDGFSIGMSQRPTSVLAHSPPKIPLPPCHAPWHDGAEAALSPVICYHRGLDLRIKGFFWYWSPGR